MLLHSSGVIPDTINLSFSRDKYNSRASCFIVSISIPSKNLHISFAILSICFGVSSKTEKNIAPLLDIILYPISFLF